MDTFTIVHHLGLGDQMVMNGLVRHLSEKGKVIIIVKESNRETVEFMYRDINIVKIEYVKTTDPIETWSKVDRNTKVIALATYGMETNIWEYLSHIFNWTHIPYLQAKVNPMYMYTKFRVDREHTKEDELYKKLVKGKYIFVHDQGSSNKTCINLITELDIIRPSMDIKNIFDYLKIIENAEEVHCINSSFGVMIELTGIAKGKRYLHTRVAYSNYSVATVESVFTEWIFT